MTTTALNILHNEKNAEFQIWLHVLKHAPSTAWKLPVLAFIKTLLKSKSKLSNKDIKRCIYFMHNLAIYIYAKNLGGALINGQSIKKEMEKAAIIAKQGKTYRPNIKITKQFKQKLNGDIPKQLRWGLCTVVEFSNNYDIFLHDLDDIDKIYKPKLKAKISMLKNAVVEQLMPSNWIPDPVIENIYNKPEKWDDQRIKKTVHTIGNFVLIEKSIHQHTSKITKEDFLTKRKKIKNGYKSSIFGELVFMCTNVTPLYNETPLRYSTHLTRQKRCIKKLIAFFTNFDGVTEY